MLVRICLKLISFVSLLLITQKSFAADFADVNTTETCVDGDTSCQRTFTENNKSLLIGEGGNIILSGAYQKDAITGEPTPFTDSGGVNLDTNKLSAFGVLVKSGVSGAKITVKANSGEGISASVINRGRAVIANELGGSIENIDLQSGTLKSTDTAILIRDSNEAGTDIVVGTDGIILGGRNAIRYDNYACINQDPSFNPTADAVNCSGGDGNYNSFSASEGKTAKENADAGIIGYLTLRIKNEGIIAANPRLIANPSDPVTNVFYSSGNSRIKSNISITNEETGKIYGHMTFGSKVFNTTYDSTKAYITSNVNITNRGLISSGNITSDFNTTLNITNEANGIIRIEQSPIAGSDGVDLIAANCPDGVCTDIYEVYEGQDNVTNKSYKLVNLGNIRPQGENSTITNYGQIIGGVNLSLKSQTINLNGGTLKGNINLSGTMNFNNDLDASAVIGSITTGSDRKDLTSSARINIGTKTYSIGREGDLAGSLIMTAGTGLNPIISTTFTNDGNLGRLNFAGETKIENGIRLNINISENYSYLKSGVDYLVIDGDSNNTGITTSDVNAVSDSKISINDGVMGNNKIGILTFYSAARDLIESTGKYKDLVIYIDRVAIDEITDDKLSKEVFKTLDEIGSSATGSLKDFQQYIDTSSNYSTIESALKSAAPINNADLELSVMAPIHKNIEATNNRVNLFMNLEINDKIKDNEVRDYNAEALRLCLSKVARENKNVKIEEDKNHSFCQPNSNEFRIQKRKLLRAKELEIKKDFNNNKEEKKESIWGEVFASTGKRDGSKIDFGYRNNTNGFIFGLDDKVGKSGIFGTSFGYSNSRVSSLNSLGNVEIDSYQISSYGGKFYENRLFWDGLVGVVLNKYNSNRSIPSVSKKANADYYGFNYVTKIRSGFIYKNFISTKITFIPEISATFAKRHANSYTEKGADTLNLNVEKTSDNYLEGRLGYNFNYDSNKKEKNLRYKFHNSYGYNFANKTQKTTASFVGYNSSFDTISSRDGSLAIRLGFGVDYQKNESTTFSLDYVSDFMTNYAAHSGIVKLNHRF